MSRQKKRLNQQAQHLIEYSVLIILVLAGIIISGPYVIRSWNARVKSWEDGVTESLQDPLLEAPAGSVTIPGCDPDPLGWISQGCGLGRHTTCMDLDCLPTQRLETLTYTPLDCECYVVQPGPPVTAQCFDDCSCCTQWSPDSSSADPFTDCGVNASPPCPDDYYRARRTCGDPTCAEGTCGPGDGTCPTVVNENDCFYDYALCHFDCTGVPAPNTPPRYGDLCLGDDTGLAADTPYSYVNPGRCTAGTKCEIQCGPTYQSYGTYCDCPPTTTFNPSTNNCDAIRVFTVATVISDGTNDQSAATSAALCGPATWIITSVTVTVCPTGNPSGATGGESCVVQLLP